MTNAELIRYAADNHLWDGFSDDNNSAHECLAIVKAGNVLKVSSWSAVTAVNNFMDDATVFHFNVGEDRQNFRYMCMYFVADLLDEGALP